MSDNYATRPLWFWNDKPTDDGIKEIMTKCKEESGYAGFGILPYNACKLEYMSEEYLDLYETAVLQAKKLGLKMCLYDEWWFPSGGAGGIMKEKYPNACAKRLDLEIFESNNRLFHVDLSAYPKVMAVVAMRETKRIDLCEFVHDDVLNWEADDNGYKVLCFVLVDAGLGRVDYLDPDSVKKFIECTHEVYYRKFNKYFGNVIDSSFYDEPQFYSAKGRAWTEIFNEKFIEKYGFSPALYYPALFFDIGEETAKARNMMFGLRAELYSTGFPKVIQEWCTEHGISLTGHVDQEEVDNPCGITGDLMLSFKYQDIPGIDEIFHEERASKAYKIVSSSAVNWNKRLVMSECFGAIESITIEGIYRETNDLFTKGINHLVPHAVWNNPDNEKVKFKPELSYRHDYYGKYLREYNEFCATVQKPLQNSGQVNSIAILYPIENLQYLYNFSWEGDPVNGGPTTETNDYLNLGQYLIRELNYDFSFLHPDVLHNNVSISNGEMIINDSIHHQRYNTIIIPGMSAVSMRTIMKLKEFVESGGTLISTSELPTTVIEYTEKDLFSHTVKELFGTNKTTDEIVKNRFGKGICYSLPSSKTNGLDEILSDKSDTVVVNKVHGLQFIHKRKDIEDIWYFASLKEDADTVVCIDGKYSLSSLDPKINKTIPVDYLTKDNRTEFKLHLRKEQSVLVFGKQMN